MSIKMFLPGSLLLLNGSVLFSRAEISSDRPPPNIVFIYTDDQRYDALGVVQKELGSDARFPWLQTPNLDKLAEEGVRFRNAFVVHSLSTPSRASFLTGKYTHSHDIFTNFTGFPEDTYHWGRALTESGYQTAFIGKWHMGEEKGKRPGFTYSASFLGQGHCFDCPFDINGSMTPTKGWVDDVSTDFTCEFIKKNKNKPFAIAMGFKAVHVPFCSPGKYQELYKDEQMGPARNHMNLPPYLGRVHFAKPEHLKELGNVLVEDKISYFRTITAMDHNVGKILELLKELELDDNTIVIFSSDNGYHLGEHGIGDKRSAYEVSIRVPLLIWCPDKIMGGRTSDALALNIDVAPTILEFAGLEVPKSMQGVSLKKILEMKEEKVRDGFLYEYFFSYGDITDFEIQTADPPITPTIVAYRTKDKKIISYPEQGWLEVFDLQNDPYEQRNLAYRSEYKELKTQLLNKLESEKERLGYRLPENYIPAPDEFTEGWRKWNKQTKNE